MRTRSIRNRFPQDNALQPCQVSAAVYGDCTDFDRESCENTTILFDRTAIESMKTDDGSPTMKCPGQDRAYWHGERVFEVPCIRCGATVEFFRDEVSRRCSRCSARLNNPRVAMDCAAWCEQAESCIGVSRARIAAIGQADTALAGKLIQALEEAMPYEPDRVHRALLVFQHARELAPSAPGSPVIFLSAALLLELNRFFAAGASGPSIQRESPTRATEIGHDILAQAQLSEDTIAAIISLLEDFSANRPEQRPEILFLRDAVVLAEMSLNRPADEEKLEDELRRRLGTEAARAWARSLFRPTPGELSAPTAVQ